MRLVPRIENTTEALLFAYKIYFSTTDPDLSKRALDYVKQFEVELDEETIRVVRMAARREIMNEERAFNRLPPLEGREATVEAEPF